MSLIQSALDKVEKLEPKPVQTLPSEPMTKTAIPEETKSASAVEHEPRLDSIKFYEVLDQQVEAAIGEVQKPFWTDQKKVLGIISVLLLFSLLATRWFMPSVPKEPAEVEYHPAPFVTLPAPTEGGLTKMPKPISKMQFTITGITMADNTKLAVINGQVVAEGDKLQEGAVVRSVADKRVILDHLGKEIILNF